MHAAILLLIVALFGGIIDAKGTNTTAANGKKSLTARNLYHDCEAGLVIVDRWEDHDWENGRGGVNHYMTMKNQSSEDACLCACAGEPTCGGFSYLNKTCHLSRHVPMDRLPPKLNKPSGVLFYRIRQRPQPKSIIHGNATAASASKPNIRYNCNGGHVDMTVYRNHNWEEGVESTDNFKVIKNSRTEDECVCACASNPKCDGFARLDGNCWLKSDVPNEEPPQVNPPTGIVFFRLKKLTLSGNETESTAHKHDNKSDKKNDKKTQSKSKTTEKDGKSGNSDEDDADGYNQGSAVTDVKKAETADDKKPAAGKKNNKSDKSDKTTSKLKKRDANFGKICTGNGAQCEVLCLKAGVTCTGYSYDAKDGCCYFNSYLWRSRV